MGAITTCSLANWALRETCCSGSRDLSVSSKEIARNGIENGVDTCWVSEVRDFKIKQSEKYKQQLTNIRWIPIVDVVFSKQPPSRVRHKDPISNFSLINHVLYSQ